MEIMTLLLIATFILFFSWVAYRLGIERGIEDTNDQIEKAIKYYKDELKDVRRQDREIHSEQAVKLMTEVMVVPPAQQELIKKLLKEKLY